MSGTGRDENGQDSGGSPGDSGRAGDEMPLAFGGEHQDLVPEEPRDPALLLAELAIGRALGRPQLRRVRAGRGGVIILIVPDTSWTGRVETVLFRDAVNSRVFAVKSERVRDREAKGGDIAAALRHGRQVVGVATTLDHLPSVLVGSADLQVTLNLPDVALVERAIRLYTRQRIKPGLVTADLVGLTLDDLAAAMRPHSSPGVIVARLRRTAARRGGAGLDEAVPRLETLSGYGAVGSWGLALAADLRRVRAGELDPSALGGALLAGPPGVGKTTFVRALARSAGVPLIATSIGEWLNNGPGYLDSIVKESNIFFKTLLSSAPCIGFIDELDALPSRTIIMNRADWWQPIITNVLLRIDAVRAAAKGVVLLAASNFPDQVDPALRRPGRLDQTLTIGLPGEADLAAILRSHLGTDLPGHDLTAAARIGLGATGADAAGWVRAARQRARIEDRSLRIDDLLDAVRPRDARSPEFLRLIALHEAGHAVVARRLGRSVERVSMLPTGDMAGSTDIICGPSAPTAQQIDDQVVVLLAGRAADLVLGTGANSGAVQDLRSATRLIAAKHAALGLVGPLCSRVDPDEADRLLSYDLALADAVECDLQELLRRAVALVRADRGAICALADALLAHRVLMASEIDRLLADWPVPRSRRAGARTRRTPEGARRAGSAGAGSRA